MNLCSSTALVVSVPTDCSHSLGKRNTSCFETPIITDRRILQLLLVLESNTISSYSKIENKAPFTACSHKLDSSVSVQRSYRAVPISPLRAVVTSARVCHGVITARLQRNRNGKLIIFIEDVYESQNPYVNTYSIHHQAWNLRYLSDYLSGCGTNRPESNYRKTTGL